MKKKEVSGMISQTSGLRCPLPTGECLGECIFSGLPASTRSQMDVRSADGPNVRAETELL